ncbi:MAG TPA: beta-glucuronidase [Spirochaetota bacterium]|nr:beta-glucuronidase [Spirochaetota bacterium]
MLYPRKSETRDVKDLSGIWRFKIDRHNKGLKEKWFLKPLANTIPMPVPASYNDITQDVSLRNHTGYVWYEKEVYLSRFWENEQLRLRFGSATHHAVVYINGRKIISHKGGFLPFEADITSWLKTRRIRITVALDNRLDWTCLPPGEVRKYNDADHPPGFKYIDYEFDFLNYAGLHRPVRIYTVPRNYIRDITITTDIKGGQGIVRYNTETVTAGAGYRIECVLLDKNNKTCARCRGNKGKISLNRAHFWSPDDPYLYSLKVTLVDNRGQVKDVYYQPVGIRSIKLKGRRFYLNNQPFYFKGFGKHEDMDIKGRGMDHALNVKDFNLLKWLGANSFRTSHYPYSEEIMNLADEMGFLVIDETPAVGMNTDDKKPIFCSKRVNKKTLAHHKDVLREMVARDKNHPCVVMWSIANEPASYEKNAGPYFKALADLTRKLDPTRPVTMVNASAPEKCQAARYLDVICFNFYSSWYWDCGRLEVIPPQFKEAVKGWKKFNKPVMLTEFGADALSGFSQSPPVMFSEEYQCAMTELIQKLVAKSGLIGEHVWAFADFYTKENIFRPIGNRKGVFTRQRQPKKIAYILKSRWQGKPARYLDDYPVKV